MNISGINGAQGAASIRQTTLKRNASAQNNATIARDEMNISAKNGASAMEATTLSLNSSEIRLDLVNRIRSEIAAGTYYTEEKMNIALERMFASFE